MSKIAKFVVIINDNVSWMEEKAIQFYSRLFEQKVEGEKYVEIHLSQKELFRIQNDFSIEILMAYDGEVPQSYLKLNSSRILNENLGASKAINLSEIIYFDEEDLTVLIKRAEEIARQRKHDLIWVSAFSCDAILIKMLLSLDYEEFDYEESIEDQFSKRIYFRKNLNDLAFS
ncbi:hypothetical protein HNP37_002853 [Flavobacterium nitrogenifigens]|uniref:Uncharacterized protein n=2 Tax=Flavobacterium TaxID=237 RepID=A0A7W7IY67_9FLAO|nr:MULTISPECIES: hypothetical protein [Flavobacterium]MBB4802778.1 hypothetical protein [Flavobacterium nitrogenifigens]MBB6387736.1 hypothetical protein [Flavobacterium notoginsengisoli]